jgi:asparagine synthase (glutamine-hydrolysing)
VLAQEPDIHWSPAYLPPLDEDGTLDPDLPFAGPAAEPDNWICQRASAAGAQVLLSGAGGDESATYNGSSIYAAMLRERRFRRLCAELPAHARQAGRPLSQIVAGSLIRPFLPAWLLAMRSGNPGQSRPGSRRSVALTFLNPSLAAQVSADLPPPEVWGSSAQDRIEMLTESYLVDRADRWSILGARHGVAFSYPLVDRRIIDFILSLPLDRFVDGGFARQPFRNAMAGILPESIRWRTTKYSPFPEIPQNLACAAPGLLRRLENLRRNPSARDIVDVLVDTTSICTALAAAAQQAATGQMKHALVHQGPLPPWSIAALHAARALILAEHAARLSGDSPAICVESVT